MVLVSVCGGDETWKVSSIMVPRPDPSLNSNQSHISAHRNINFSIEMLIEGHGPKRSGLMFSNVHYLHRASVPRSMRLAALGVITPDTRRVHISRGQTHELVHQARRSEIEMSAVQCEASCSGRRISSPHWGITSSHIGKET